MDVQASSCYRCTHVQETNYDILLHEELYRYNGEGTFALVVDDKSAS